jgi:hypothetical protein
MFTQQEHPASNGHSNISTSGLGGGKILRLIVTFFINRSYTTMKSPKLFPSLLRLLLGFKYFNYI